MSEKIKNFKKPMISIPDDAKEVIWTLSKNVYDTFAEECSYL